MVSSHKHRPGAGPGSSLFLADISRISRTACSYIRQRRVRGREVSNRHSPLSAFPRHRYPRRVPALRPQVAGLPPARCCSDELLRANTYPPGRVLLGFPFFRSTRLLFLLHQAIQFIWNPRTPPLWDIGSGRESNPARLRPIAPQLKTFTLHSDPPWSRSQVPVFPGCHRSACLSSPALAFAKLPSDGAVLEVVQHCTVHRQWSATPKGICSADSHRLSCPLDSARQNRGDAPTI
jgi:hypothetical protein